MIHILARLECLPEKLAEVRALLADMAAASLQEPGCLHYQVLQAVEETNCLFILENYLDQAALDAHRQSAYYRAYRAAVSNCLKSPIQVQTWQAN